MTDQTRIDCHLDFLRRSEACGIGYDGSDIGRLEDMCERARPLYEISGETRYVLNLLIDRRRIRLVYDTNMQAVQSVWEVTHRPLPKDGR